MKSNNVVVSTRIRLARNLREYAFPNMLSIKEKEKIVDKIHQLPLKTVFINMKNLTEAQAVSLVERHLVSPEFAHAFEGKGLFLDEENKEKILSIMVNEEDHLRIQSIVKGLDLKTAYEKACEADEIISEKLEYAYDESMGYLTQCPTNLGTGMRASVMLHLPGLQKTRTIASLAQNLSKLGLTIRGIYGEGTEPKGALYQLSNQITLGISEKTAIENLNNITLQLIASEENARKTLLNSIVIKDAVSRSFGILKYAQSMNHSEALELLSNVRFGVSEKYLEVATLEQIDDLIQRIQPANIMVEAKEDLTPQDRDVKRAEIIKSAF